MTDFMRQQVFKAVQRMQSGEVVVEENVTAADGKSWIVLHAKGEAYGFAANEHRGATCRERKSRIL